MLNVEILEAYCAPAQNVLNDRELHVDIHEDERLELARNEILVLRKCGGKHCASGAK